jgi:ABC-type multidrug transport system fused ATPase/permease subunit
MADPIVALDKGRVVEQGSHAHTTHRFGQDGPYAYWYSLEAGVEC